MAACEILEPAAAEAGVPCLQLLAYRLGAGPQEQPPPCLQALVAGADRAEWPPPGHRPNSRSSQRRCWPGRASCAGLALNGESPAAGAAGSSQLAAVEPRPLRCRLWMRSARAATHAEQQLRARRHPGFAHRAAGLEPGLQRRRKAKTGLNQGHGHSPGAKQAACLLAGAAAKSRAIQGIEQQRLARPVSPVCTVRGPEALKAPGRKQSMFSMPDREAPGSPSRDWRR